MIFGVHNYYNNNCNVVDSFSLPVSDDMVSESPVRVTDQGITIFVLDKLHGLDYKLVIAERLHNALFRKFGKGLSFASSGDSDCVPYHELNPFYARVKEIVPYIVTMYSAFQYPEGDWMGVPKDLKVDCIVDSGRMGARKIVEILNPNDQDRAKPVNGWKKYERRLNQIYIKCLGQQVKCG